MKNVGGMTRNAGQMKNSNTHAFQAYYSYNMYTGISNDSLYVPNFLHHKLKGATYKIFLEEVLPELLNTVPVAVLNSSWFQHDRASTDFRYYHTYVINILRTQFHN